jgi:hypothetical protein
MIFRNVALRALSRDEIVVGPTRGFVLDRILGVLEFQFRIRDDFVIVQVGTGGW